MGSSVMTMRASADAKWVLCMPAATAATDRSATTSIVVSGGLAVCSRTSAPPDQAAAVSTEPTQ